MGSIHILEVLLPLLGSKLIQEWVDEYRSEAKFRTPPSIFPELLHFGHNYGIFTTILGTFN